MQHFYIISLLDVVNMHRSYNIVAPAKNLAEAEARTLAGVASDAEVITSQNMTLLSGGIHSIVT